MLGVLFYLLQSDSRPTWKETIEVLRSDVASVAQREQGFARLPALLALRSEAPVCAAAYLTAVHVRTECAAALLEALRWERSQVHVPSTRLLAALFDALIQLKTAVPADLVLAQPSESLAEFYYLLLENLPEPLTRASALQELVQLNWRESAGYWAALCAWIALGDTAAVQHTLYAEPWDLQFLVVEDSNQNSSSHSIGRWSTPHASWPPRVHYEIALPERDAALYPLVIRRSEHTKSGPAQRRVLAAERSMLRARLLAQLLASEEAITEFPGYLPYKHTYTDETNFSEALMAYCRHARAQISGVERKLVEQHWLDGALPGLTLRVVVRDLRQGDPAPLPRPAQPAGVEFGFE